MNYRAIYCRFIEHRRSNPPRDDELCHWHHIIPKCDGGFDFSENLIRLTIADHQFAHLLLAKAEGSPGNWLAVLCIFGSIKTPTKSQRRQAELAAAETSITRRGNGNPFFGRTHSPKARAEITAAMNRPEAKARMSALHRGRVLSPEHRAKISAGCKGKVSPMLGRHHSPEAKSKISRNNGLKRIGFSAEHRVKLSIAAKIREARRRETE